MTHHPNLHLVDVRCASCGRTFSLQSTAETLSVDICSACHPAYTGRERAVADGSRIERFNRRYVSRRRSSAAARSSAPAA
jgi:large subunit ribosomal protein L31